MSGLSPQSGVKRTLSTNPSRAWRRAASRHPAPLRTAAVNPRLAQKSSLRQLSRRRGANVNANQVFGWRKRYRDASRAPAVLSAPQLIPVMVTAEPDAVAAQPSTVAATIEIDLADQYRVRISGGIDAHALRRVLDVLERR
jgi:transposase-like protein